VTGVAIVAGPGGALKAGAGIDLAAAELLSAPFRHFVLRRCIDPSTADALLAWFETAAPWRLVETDFYEQYEFNLFDAVLPGLGAQLTDPIVLSEIRSQLAVLFGVEFEDRVGVVAHKLSPGQRTAIHNDYLTREETHRLVIHLNRGLHDEDGGLFMLFNSSDPSDIFRVLRPLNLSDLGFEISARSFHAVSRMHAGDRYTLVFSFYATAAARRSLGRR
jgi:hypothetical protein